MYSPTGSRLIEVDNGVNAAFASDILTNKLDQSASSASAQMTPSWGQALCMLEGQVPIQRELDRLDKWATGTSRSTAMANTESCPRRE